MKKFISVFVAVVTALSFTGCGQTTTSENKNLEKVTVVLDWTPNTLSLIHISEPTRH